MSRLAPLDKALVLILVPLWAVCFALATYSSIRGIGFSSVYVSSPGAHAYPELLGIRPWLPGEKSGLRSGDRLIRLGEEDLRGVGPVGMWSRVPSAAGTTGGVRVAYERDGAPGEAWLPVGSMRTFWPFLPASLVFAVAALLLILRVRARPAVRAFFFASIWMAINLASNFGGGHAVSAASLWLHLLATALVLPLTLRAMLRFPEDVVPEGAWARAGPWLFTVLALFEASASYGLWLPPEVGVPGFFVTALLGLATVLALGTRSYRRATAVGRRQLRWLVFGLYVVGLPPLAAAALAAVEPRLTPIYQTSIAALGLFPLFLLVAVGRFNLFDVDRLISATAAYNILVVILGAGALVVVPRIAEAASELVGIGPDTGQVALSLLLAGFVVPAQRRLRPRIDRLLFKDRYALDHGIAELLATLSQCPDARALTARVGSALSHLLRPEASVVYAVVGESWAPVFAEGRAVPPSFGGASPLVAALGERRTPLALGDAGRRPDDAPLGPFEHAALATLQAEVVVPVRQDDGLAAFLCLGPKRSGDVYTSSDLSLLAAVAERVSSELRRFDQEETVKEAREMQDSLRRYVPGAIAEQLSSGAELAPGKREVTVLFVDIRGYTIFSESRDAAEIFSTVNRYTQTVSEIVYRHGGSVVEFNGDGMMTVFGAPRDLAHKEQAAVEAGREIVEAVGALTVEDAQGGETKLAVGVGIATGEAFVGNIQAVDRMIWSAIGNTTNLAARLQSLTRDLDAALVVDDTTWERAQAAAGDFQKRSEVPIRGRRETQDLYALPLRSGP